MTDDTEKTPSPRTTVTRLTGRISQCMGCGEVFGGEKAFDAHRVWHNGRRVCRDPATTGLAILTGRTGTRWGEPMSQAARERAEAA